MKYRSVHQLGPDHVGHRVTVRRRLPDGGYSDVVGVLEHAGAAYVTVRTHDGKRHEIVRSEIAAARVVTLPPLQHPENPAPG